MNRKCKLDPYIELGVGRDAGPEDIKKAYRKRARETHPDAGGSQEAFSRANTAHVVLLDSKKRSHFDRTGEIEDDAPDNEEQAALTIISRVLAAIVEGSPEPWKVDLVAPMIKIISDQKDEVVKQGVEAKRKLAKAAKLRGRFKRKKNKPGAVQIENIIIWMERSHKEAAENCEAAARDHQRAIDILSEFSFEAEDQFEAFFRLTVLTSSATG